MRCISSVSATSTNQIYLDYLLSFFQMFSYKKTTLNCLYVSFKTGRVERTDLWQLSSGFRSHVQHSADTKGLSSK